MTNPRNRGPADWDRVLAAAQKNQPDRIRKLVREDGIDPNHTNPVGQTALHIAALWGHVDSLKALLEFDKINVNAINKLTGATPLHLAVQSRKKPLQGRVDVVRALLEFGADSNQTDYHGSTAMDHAEEQEIRFAFELWFKELEMGDSSYATLLKIASIIKNEQPNDDTNNSNRIETIKELITPDLLEFRIGRTQMTPLLYLVEHMVGLIETPDAKQEEIKELIDILSLFLEMGANPNVARPKHSEPILKTTNTEDQETTPTHQILSVFHQLRPSHDDWKISLLESSVRMLMQHGATVPQCTQERLLPDAARRNRFHTIRLLLGACKVDVNQPGRQGMTALHFAARSGHIEMTEYLLSLPDINVRATDDRGKTPADAVRVLENRTEILQMLTDKEQA